MLGASIASVGHGWGWPCCQNETKNEIRKAEVLISTAENRSPAVDVMGAHATVDITGARTPRETKKKQQVPLKRLDSSKKALTLTEMEQETARMLSKAAGSPNGKDSSATSATGSTVTSIPPSLERDFGGRFDRFDDRRHLQNSAFGISGCASATGSDMSMEDRDAYMMARMQEITAAAAQQPQAGGSNLPPLRLGCRDQGYAESRSIQCPGGDRASNASTEHEKTMSDIQARLEEVEARARHYEEQSNSLMKLTEADYHLKDHARKNLFLAESRAKTAEEKAVMLGSRMTMMDDEYEKMRTMIFRKEHEIQLMKADMTIAQVSGGAYGYPGGAPGYPGGAPGYPGGAPGYPGGAPVGPGGPMQYRRPPDQEEQEYAFCGLPRKMCG